MSNEHLTGVLDHKKLVGHYMQIVATELFKRAVEHDYSKFTLEEFDDFERMTPILKTLTYGTDEYKAALKELGPALQHHYEVNSHHPEYYPNGINGMSLIDLIEMVCDWLAAVERVKDGDIYKSLETNKERFGINDQLAGIIRHTVGNIRMAHRDKTPDEDKSVVVTDVVPGTSVYSFPRWPLRRVDFQQNGVPGGLVWREEWGDVPQVGDRLEIEADEVGPKHVRVIRLGGGQ